MNKNVFIALGAGFTSAVLSLSLMSGSTVALFFLYLAPLPIFLVGLGQGLKAGTLAALAGLFFAGIMAGPVTAVLYGAMQALPATMMTRHLLLQRKLGPEKTVDWYPFGTSLCWLATLGAAFLVSVALVTYGNGSGGLEKAVTSYLDEVFKAMLPNQSYTERTQVVSLLSPWFPGLVGTSWVIMTVANAAFAQAVLVRSGKNVRPALSLTRLTLPDWFSWVFVGALVIAVIGPEETQYAGRCLALILAVPYFLLGLGTVHLGARKTRFPGMLLGAFYVFLILSGWVVLLTAGVGILEHWFGIRRYFPDDPDRA